MLDNCMEKFDILAEEFTRTDSKADQEKLVDEARKAAEGLENENEKKSADVYVKLMQKVLERGAKFIESESERVKNLLAGKLSEAKKAELNIRVNILQSFSHPSSTEGGDSKQEL